MRAVFVFDGDCGFCSSSARFLQRWVRPAVPVEPWQRLDLAALGLTRAQCQDAVQLTAQPRPFRGSGSPALANPAGTGEPGGLPAGTAVLTGPAAIAAVLRIGLWPWRPVGWLLGLRPMQTVAWPLYRWVARHRHQLPGGSAACALPPRP
jgi:predicted DCC family thiol-disulfide oxidoreductase YuxK